MAIYRAGSLAVGISGSVGGVTFVNARGSSVIRFRPPPRTRKVSTRPSQGFQIENAQQRAIQGWQALTDEIRTSWRTLANNTTFPNRLGQKRSISGYALYIRVNTYRAIAGRAALTTAPSTARPQQFSDIVISATVSAGLKITGEWPTAQDPKPVLIYGALSFHPNADRFFRDFRFLLVGFVFKSVLVSIKIDWEARYGPLRLGQPIAIRALPWDDDTYPGTPFQKSAVVTA